RPSAPVSPPGVTRVRRSASPVVHSAQPVPGRAASAGLARSGLVLAQHRAQLFAGADVELLEDFAQMPFDRSRADEQPATDLRIGQPVARQQSDLPLLLGQLFSGSDGACANDLARCEQLTAGPVGECLHPVVAEHLMGDAQLAAGIRPASLPTQPLAVEKVCAGEFGPHRARTELADGLVVARLGGLALTGECARASQQSEPPALIRAAYVAGESFERLDR